MNRVTLNAFMDELRKTAGLRDAGAWAKKSLQGGIKNVGNSISAFATPVQSAKAGARRMGSDLRNASRSGKPLGLGMAALQLHGLYSQGGEALRPHDSTGEGRSRLHRTATLVGDQVGGLIGARHGMMGQLTASMIGRKAGDLAGKTIDFARGYRRPAPVGGQG